MKKRIISVLLVIVLVSVLVPQMATGASASQKLAAAPYTPVEYQYSKTATPGTIRFVNQLKMSPYFYPAYWEEYVDYAGHECLTACVSMALSYIGVSATPAELGDYWNAKGYTGGVPFTTIQWDTADFGGNYIKTSLDSAMANYLNGNGAYSPAVIHLNTYSERGHWVVVAGKINANTYMIVDPANDTPWPMTFSNGNVSYERNGTVRTEPATEVFQYSGGPSSSVMMSALTHADGTVCPSVAYKDMPSESHWAHKGIDFCVDKGLMNGVDSSHFQPEAQMTRAMLVTVLYRTAGAPAVSGSVHFSDLNADWYQNAVIWAYNNGITSGVSGDRFDPDGTVTREQLVAMLYRFKVLQTGTETIGGNAIAGYGDWDAVSDWAIAAFNWAIDCGIINGIDGQLQPQASADRAQIATILMRYLQA